MKNKFPVIIIVFITISLFQNNQLIAQVSTTANNTGSIKVDSYNGNESKSIFTVFLEVSGQNVNYPFWSLLVKANPTISSSEGKSIDPSRISIRLNRIENGLTFQELGANKTPIPLSFTNRYLFERSSTPLKVPNNGYYKQYIFYFDILVSGGDYLESLINDNNDYNLNLTFSVIDENNRVIRESNVGVGIRIYPRDLPPSGPTYGIEINSNARNGLLNLKSVTDYVNGVEQVYENGLTITSKTDYQVQVRSLSSNFESGKGMTLPISTVSLQIQDSKNSGVGGTIVLSEGLQTVFSASNPGNNKKPRDFNLRYFTKPQDERLINAKPASYQTTLMFTLLPQ